MQLELPFVTHFTARHSTQRDDRHGADRTATGVSRHRARFAHRTRRRGNLPGATRAHTSHKTLNSK